MATVEQAVDGYRKLRDLKKDMQDKHKEELAPINSKMEKIENFLKDQLNNAGCDSMKTSAGTVFKSRLSSVKVDDWEETLKFIQENELWHMLEKRLAKASVEEFVEGNGHDVPGTHITFIQKVNVRKS